MNKVVYGLVIYTMLFGSSYNGSTQAPVILSGAVIKAQASPINIKYKRKKPTANDTQLLQYALI